MDSFTITFPFQSPEHPTVAIKDSIDIINFPTLLGSAACTDQSPAKKNAEVVTQLKQAGYCIIGKTVMHELAYGMTGINEFYGTPINPKYPQLIPGGSSSGSATAVASGAADVAIGTDTGGSVRLPAACCGIYGMKPTFNLVSRLGVWPSNTSLDCVGVFANTAKQIAEVMTAIAPGFTPVTPENSTYRLGWLSVDVDETILAATQSALASCDNIQLSQITLSEFDKAFHAGMTLINHETWVACKNFYTTGKLGTDVAKRLEKASHTSNQAIADAERVRTRFTQQVDNALQHVDALVLPTLPHFPMTRTEGFAGKIDLTISKLVRPFNLSGHPAITIPCPTATDMPIGIQLVGRKGDDALLCALAENIANTFSY